jgi:hypothetical protein
MGSDKYLAIGLSILGTKMLLDSLKQKQSEFELIDELTLTIGDADVINALMDYRKNKIQYVYIISSHIKKITNIEVDIKGVINKSDIREYLNPLITLNTTGRAKFNNLITSKYKLLRLLNMDKFQINRSVTKLSKLIKSNIQDLEVYSVNFYHNLESIINRYDQINNISKSDGNIAKIYYVNSNTPIPNKEDILKLLSEYYKKLETEKYIVSSL